MSYASVQNALVQQFQRVPGLTTVQRGDELRLGKRGSVVPNPGETPAVRIQLGYVRGAGRGRERPVTHSGAYWRTTPYQVELWATVDDEVVQADGFQALADALQQTVRTNRTLSGAADTATEKLLRAQVVVADPLPRPFAHTNGKSYLRHSFSVEAVEEIHA